MRNKKIRGTHLPGRSPSRRANPSLAWKGRAGPCAHKQAVARLGAWATVARAGLARVAERPASCSTASQHEAEEAAGPGPAMAGSCSSQAPMAGRRGRDGEGEDGWGEEMARLGGLSAWRRTNRRIGWRRTAAGPQRIWVGGVCGEWEEWIWGGTGGREERAWRGKGREEGAARRSSS